MSFEQFVVVLGWFLGASLVVAGIEFLIFVGARAIRTSTLVSNLYARMALFLVLIAVGIASIIGVIGFALGRSSLALAM